VGVYSVIVGLLGFLFILSETACAESGWVRFAANSGRDAKANLQLTQAPLDFALDTIAKSAQLQIHYSNLPEGSFTVTCVEPTLTRIFSCMLNGKAHLAFRYLQNTQSAPGKLAEVWVFGMHDVPKEIALASETNQDSGITKGGLAARDALLSALSDTNAEVRTQAVSTLANYRGPDSSDLLQSVLLDSDASVRLMAVDQADGHPHLLRQALNDSDASVRAYAALKLKALSTP